MKAGTAIFQWLWCCALGLLLMQSVQAQTYRDEWVIGQRSDLVEREFQLTAGTYRLVISNPLQNSGQPLSAAQGLIAMGDQALARVSLAAPDASFTLSRAGSVRLYLAARASSGTGLLIAQLRREGEATVLLDEAFLFDSDSDTATGRRYVYENRFPVAAGTPAVLEVTDFGAQGLGTPLDSLLVLVTYRDAQGTLQHQAWDVSTTRQYPFTAGAGDIYLNIIGLAPATGISQLGWSLTLNGEEAASDVAQIDDSSVSPGEQLAEFDLTASTPVNASLNLLTDTSDFSLVIASGTELLELSNRDRQGTASLGAGHYKVLLLTGTGSTGLAGLRIQAGDTRVVDTSFTLGDYRRLGSHTQTVAASLSAGLHLFLQPADLTALDIALANSQTLALNLDLANPAQAATLPAGDYQVWTRANQPTADGYYRVHLQQGNAQTEWWGSLGNGHVDSIRLSLTQATTGTLKARNFNLPDSLSAAAELLVVQGDSLVSRFSIDPDDAGLTATDLSLPAGDLQLALFSPQAAGKATVLGYHLETVDPATPSDPSRGANGRGGSGGGGGFASFFLYSFLMLRWLRVRRRPARA